MWNDTFTTKKPAKFELVEIKTSKDKVCTGWWTGSSWYAIRLNKNDIVTHYKKKPGNSTKWR